MTDDWRITDHSPDVALRLAHQWAVAARAQARRVQHPQHAGERVPDTYLLVMALQQVLTAAQMAKRTVTSRAAKADMQRAIGIFLDEIVVATTGTQHAEALTLARDVLVHFDEYLSGTGRRQRRDHTSDLAKTAEDLAQDYRIDFDPPADQPRLRLGLRPAPARVTIDLVTTAPEAASRLAEAIGTAITRGQASAAHE